MYLTSGSWRKDQLLLCRQTDDKLVVAFVWMMLRAVLESLSFGGKPFTIYEICQVNILYRLDIQVA